MWVSKIISELSILHIYFKSRTAINQNEYWNTINRIIVQILSTRIDRSEQIVQGLYCLPINMHLWMHYCIVNQLFHFRTFTLTLLHSERPKLYAILAFLSAIGLIILNVPLLEVIRYSFLSVTRTPWSAILHL